MRPTAAGQLLARHAARLLDGMTEAEVALQALSAGQAGTLRVASFATAGAQLIPPALARVRAALPSLEITLRITDREEALSLLRRDMLDLAVIEDHAARPPADDGLTYRPLLTDPFQIVLPRHHHLAARRAISLAEAADESWIDIRCEIGCCRAATSAAFGQAGFTPRRAVEANEYWPAQGFVAAGLGLALIPALALGVQHNGVAVRRLHVSCQPGRHVIAVTRPALASTVPVQAMLDALQAEATHDAR